MVQDMAKRALYGSYKVGGDCLTVCTRCKMELAHVIVAMLDGSPTKVICKTCKSQHNYKKSKGLSSGSGVRSVQSSRKAVPRSVVRVSEVWQKKLSESSQVQAPYDLRQIYNKGSIIEHVKFGLGIVEEVKDGRKINVLFRDGERTLIHGQGGVASNGPKT